MAAQRVDALWYRPSGLAYALLPLSALYFVGMHVRHLLYSHGIIQRARLAVPVVVIGNITVGGTGKTPLTIWLAERLMQQGLHPGVVCRSYAASARDPGRVRVGDDPRIRGDEAVLLATRLSCPVWSGPDRVDTALALLAQETGIDVIVCDDGLQHYALERDCEIAVIDGERAFGNAFMLPAGPLREPRSRLQRVDAIVINGDEANATLPPHVPRFCMALRGRRVINVADKTRTRDPAEFQGRKIAAIAGIGNPERFFGQLRALGLSFTAYPYPDHYDYREHVFSSLDADAVLMTEKDAIKCARFRDPRMWAFPICAELNGDLLGRVLERIGAQLRHTGSPRTSA